MENLLKKISEIISNEVNNINENVKGLNFLEILKVNIIENCSSLLSEKNFPLEKSLDFEENIEKNIFIAIKYYTKSFSVSKKNINYNSLLMSFNETINIDIFEDKKKYTSLTLFKNNGVTIPKNSIVNLIYNKNVLSLEIQNKNIEQTLTK